MPTYEYKCTECEELFEYFQKITDPPFKECPVCGGEIKRLISGGAGIIFKGSGFYSTDNKSSSASADYSSKNKKESEIKKEEKKTAVTNENKKDSQIKT